ITSGGHSFSANFLRDDCLLIDMKHFNQFSVNAEEKTAEAGPGVGGSTLMKALYKKDLFFPAGHCQGVCLGGYLLQGGYGWNSRKLGIACESVWGLDIVTADGELVYADKDTNADLFWAARGAGAGFFGIVVKFYLNVYDLPKYRAVIAHDFKMKHLEDVYRWAYDVGPEIPKAVEFQMVMNRNMMGMLGPGIEAAAPIFADTKEEFEEAKSFMKNSPIAHKAIIRTPVMDWGINMLYKTVMSHYPDDYCWGVDNIWTHATIDELLPYIKGISETLPPSPSHFLWLNWHPGELSEDMAYSSEDNIYLSLYSCWKNPADTAKYGNWASDTLKNMQHLSSGIQLADEGLHKRTDQFMTKEKFEKVQLIRSQRDPSGLFHEWHSKPEYGLSEV
ncbi:MAG: FAD-binding protein, partial [Bacteroidota bacterium]